MSGRYYLTWSILPYGARQMLGPVKTVSGFGRRAQDKRRIGSGRRWGDAALPSPRMSPRCWSLPQARFGVATLSFDSPTAFREFEVYGTKRSSACPIRGRLMSPSYFTRRT
jgi:hypothetical protein